VADDGSSDGSGDAVDDVGDGDAGFHRGVVVTRRAVLKTHRNRAANDERRLRKELELAESL